MGRCDLMADQWPLPTGGIVAEPDFFHLIGIVWRISSAKSSILASSFLGEFWGFWMAGGWGGWRASEPASGISDVQYTREWGGVGWGRVTRGWLAWGAMPIREWGHVGERMYARISGGVGIPGG